MPAASRAIVRKDGIFGHEKCSRFKMCHRHVFQLCFHDMIMKAFLLNALHGKGRKQMKKTIAILISVLLLAVTLSSFVFAENEPVKAFVTISNGKGEIVVAYAEVEVTDADNDGQITVCDALFTAHEKYYQGGAEAGFAAINSEYGLSLSKLWGEENGDSYGYFLNDTACMSLADPVKTGDSLYAYVYTDLTAWSDTYSYFDIHTKQGKAGDKLELTLSCAGYDADWKPIVMPVSGAIITVDGKDTDIVTDEEGKATITIEEGEHKISARSDSMTLVPPLCLTSNPAPAANNIIYYIIIAAVIIAVIVCLLALRAKHAKK